MLKRLLLKLKVWKSLSKPPNGGSSGKSKNTLKINFKRENCKLGIIAQINENVTLGAVRRLSGEDTYHSLRTIISGREGAEPEPRIRKSLCSEEKHPSTECPGKPALAGC